MTCNAQYIGQAMPIDLAALGWTPRLAETFTPFDAEGLVPARVALEHTHIYRVFAESGEWLARVSGKLRHRASARTDFPAVGDWVAVEPPASGSDARIHALLPRFSRFSRRAAGDLTVEQIVAANIDTVFLVSGLDGNFNPRRIERYLVVARESGASPVVVLNKADLVDDPAAMVEEVRSLAPGVTVYAVSCREPGSVEVLRASVGFGKTGALLGSSGVGKSSIVNQLVGHDMLRTGEVRTWDSRGRHVSNARQLVMLPGEGVLIDTPGMRELQLWETSESLAGTFSDIEERAAECRFRDCQHQGEPGCAVQAAVEAGDIALSRLESFHKLAGEQAYQARQQDERALIEQKRLGRIGSKALRKHLKDKGKT
jgi:ribosome biogenesis GTPase / thiamine phosphate phosphatase